MPPIAAFADSFFTNAGAVEKKAEGMRVDSKSQNKDDSLDYCNRASVVIAFVLTVEPLLELVFPLNGSSCLAAKVSLQLESLESLSSLISGSCYLLAWLL